MIKNPKLSTRWALALVLSFGLACASSQTGGSDSGSDPRGTISEGTDPGLGSRANTGGGGMASGAELTTVYFDYDASLLSRAAKSSLQANAALLKNSPGMRVEIQGHCDERGTAEYNLALGKRRAESARRYLLDLGVESGQLSTTSYGEEQPAARGSSESAWSRNRRDDFVRR